MLRVNNLNGFGYSAGFTPARIKADVWIDAGDIRTMREEITGASATTQSVDGGLVGSIFNKGTLGGWFTSPTTGERPTINGRLLTFSGAQSLIRTSGLSITTFVMVVAAESTNVPTDGRGIVTYIPTGSPSTQDWQATSGMTLNTGTTSQFIRLESNSVSVAQSGTGATPMAVYEVSRASGVTELLVNGTSIGTSASLLGAATSGGNIEIGRRNVTGTFPLTGSVKGFVHVSRALDASELNALRAFMIR
jgi:hypothetical protein